MGENINWNNVKSVTIDGNKVTNFSIGSSSIGEFPTFEISGIYSPGTLIIDTDTTSRHDEIKNKIKEMGKEKGDNMEKIDNILERYKKYQIDFIDADTKTNIALIRENSEIGKLVKKIKKQFVKEIEKLYPEEKNKENLIHIKYVDIEDLRKEIDEEIENRNTRIEALNSDLADAKALIEIAETFEQKMEILKNYKILDNEGRINIYEKE